MDKFLIYISYDQYEYTNYFHLAVNAAVVLEYRLQENVDEVLQTILEKGNAARNFELCIVQDKDALEWDFLKAFQEYGIELYPIKNEDSEQICQTMDKLFDGEYKICQTDDNSDKKLISIIYFGKCVLQKNACETDETLRQAEEILKHGGEEMTELARIIREKYKRMSKNE